jgi:SAM-dependent methyltransferase
VLGSALDGGWWVIGWRRADPRVIFAGIPMSAPTTGLAQENRLLALGFDLHRADPKRDIDDAGDLAAIAAAYPHLRTAALGRVLGVTDPLVLRADDGTVLPLDPQRWHADPSPHEEALLAGVAGPVLDVGCGPGRLVLGLARRGSVALGVDPAPAACALARDRGAAVLQRSVFDPLPGQGRWRTVLLADGNIGIGGDPARLLRRCRDLLAPDGTVVVEVEAPAGAGCRQYRVRLERGRQHGPWFHWAVVDADAIAGLAGTAGLELLRLHRIAAEGRWFAHLGRPRSEERSVAVA